MFSRKIDRIYELIPRQLNIRGQNEEKILIILITRHVPIKVSMRYCFIIKLVKNKIIKPNIVIKVY